MPSVRCAAHESHVTRSAQRRQPCAWALSREWGEMSFPQSEGSLACGAEWCVIWKKKTHGNRVDYYYYPYFNCFSCHSDSSFLTHSVLSRFFMSDVSVRSIPTSLKMEFIKKEWGRPLKLFTETLERDWWYFDAEDHSSSSVCFAPAVMTFEKTSRTCTQKKKLKRPTAFKYGSEVFMGTRVEQPCTALSVFCGFLSIFPAF